MELFKWVFSIVMICGVSAQHGWIQSVQKHQSSPPPQQQLNVHTVSADKCDVEQSEKIKCGTPNMSPEQCEAINCCFDGHQCYYGKAVTVQCTRDGQFIVVVARDATVPSIDVGSISLLDGSDQICGPVDGTSAFVVFQFPVTACGTTLKDVDGDYVIYENHMSSSYEVGLGPRGSITRDSHFELLFQCKYSGSAVEVVVMEVNPVPAPVSVAAAGPIRVALKLGNGQCHAKGCVEEEAAFNSFYTPADYPITKVLREPVYVEVQLLGRSDPNIILTLEHCWATSTPNPQSLPQWDLLVNGCPYHDDRYMTTMVPVGPASGLEYPTHYKRFVSKMFAFVAPDSYSPQKETVFIHCETAVCYQSGTNSCQQHCHRQRREAVPVPSSQRFLVSSGKVLFTEG